MSGFVPMGAVRPLLLGVALLAACAPPPPERRPPLETEVPDVWAAAGGATRAPEPGVAWWDDFADPLLSRVVEQAQQHNHDLLAAAARVEQAVAQAKIAGAERKPEVGAGAEAGRQQQVFVGLPIGGSDEPLRTEFSSYGVSLNISWEVDLWGRLRAGARAAVADLQAAQADYEAARLSLAGQTVKAWLSAAAAAQNVDLARRTVLSWRGSYRQLRDRYEQGLRSPLDVRLARSTLADAEALLELRLRQQDAAVRQLEILMGRYPGRDLEEPQVLPDLPGEIPGGLPAELVARRPDLAAAERRLAASDQRYEAARRSLYPRLTLTASAGTASNELADLVDGNFSVWSLVGGLVQPLFQGGRLRANVNRTSAAGDEALESYIAAALRAYREVETALAAEGYLRRRDELLAESAFQAAAARRLAEGRYRSGLEDYVTVLESQRRELTTESQLLEVRQARLENRVDLYLALGGGFARSAPPPGVGTAEARRVSTELQP